MLLVIVGLSLVIIVCLIALSALVNSMKDLALKMDQDRKNLAAAILNNPKGHETSIINLATRAFHE